MSQASAFPNPAIPSPSSSNLQSRTLREKYNRAPQSHLPQIRDLPTAFIDIRHPGYSDGLNTLMRFRVFDRVNGKDGAHYGTILTACHIVSGRDTGYLTSDKEGSRIILESDDLLVQGTYYYTIPDDHRYAIFPSFQEWPFPHDHLPSAWTGLKPPSRTSSITVFPARSFTAQAIIDRDPNCLLSRMGDVRERAHICPKRESSWFLLNDMNRYNLNPDLTPDGAVDDISNATAMRADIHTAYDDSFFVIVPKEGSWTVHFTKATRHLGSLYHNTRVGLHPDISVEHMYSRFAWTIFPLVKYFLMQGFRRRIRTRDINGAIVDHDFDKDTITNEFFNSTPKARSVSPKKRKTPGDDSVEVSGLAEDVEDRGRKRKRASSANGEGKIEKSRTKKSPRILIASPGCAVKDISTATSSANMLVPATSGNEPALPPTTGDEHRSEDASNGFDDTGIADHDPRVQLFYSKEDKYARMRRKELDRRRPEYDPNLFCCDYVRNRESVLAALKGEGSWGTYQLCDLCVGGEYPRMETDFDE
ncbi:MAG: hypothetical protein Q9219_007604 [cf. Caloplaca sp. 3 TL-2023]